MKTGRRTIPDCSVCGKPAVQRGLCEPCTAVWNRVYTAGYRAGSKAPVSAQELAREIVAFLNNGDLDALRRAAERGGAL
jgi:hypothetical protein